VPAAQPLWAALDLVVVTARHVPVEIEGCPFNSAVHALHAIVQASLQQTPSAMIPDAHSSVSLAGVPLVFWLAQVPVAVSQ
jgi:hypothetical protein